MGPIHRLVAVVLLTAAGCGAATTPETPLAPPVRGAPVGFTSDPKTLPIADYDGHCHEGIWSSYRVYAGDCEYATCMVIGVGHCTFPSGDHSPIACNSAGGAGVWMTTQNGYWQCAT